MGSGKQFGSYELIAKVGQGGMGAVYRARQVAMDRIVAVKILPKNLALEDGLIHRFLREAQTAGKVNHPNMVHVYEVDQVDGYYFFSMEYVDGPTLRDVLEKDGPLDEDTALYYMSKTAAALGEAHRQGIVHRDVKPENIMIDQQGEPKLCDLGIAKPMSGEMDLTLTGSAVGTPRYMSPEQAKGDPVDGRSDLYNLGATFYYVLSGNAPFKATTVTAIAVKQATEDPKPLRGLRPDISRKTEAVIMKLLARNVEDRYQDAETLIEDLDLIAVGKKPKHVSCRSDTSRIKKVDAARPSVRHALTAHRRNTGILIGAIAGGVVLVIILLLLLLGRRGGERSGMTSPSPEPAAKKPAVEEVPDGPRPAAWTAAWTALPGTKPEETGKGYNAWVSFDTKRRRYLYFAEDAAVFAYSVADAAWARISDGRTGDGTSWPKRFAALNRNTLAPYDETRDRVWFGIAIAGPDQWALYFDVAGSEWHAEKKRGHPPGGALCWIPSKDLIINTYGESCYARLYPQTMEWKLVGTVGPDPGRMLALAAAVDTKRGRIVVPYGLTQQMHILDPKTNEWTVPPLDRQLPGAAGYGRVVYDEYNDLVVVVCTAEVTGKRGMYFSSGEMRRDVWVYDPERNRWVEASVEGKWPFAEDERMAMARIGKLCYDPEGRQILGLVWTTGTMWSLKITPVK